MINNVIKKFPLYASIFVTVNVLLWVLAAIINGQQASIWMFIPIIPLSIAVYFAVYSFYKMVEQERKECQDAYMNEKLLAKRIMRFVSDRSIIKEPKDGCITIECPDLWCMTDDEFKEIFGVEFNENQLSR